MSLINGGIMEGITIKQCTGPEGSHTLGVGRIELSAFKYFEFPLISLSQGWRCDFEYKSAVTNVVHTANVLVWQGILHAASTDDVDATPESSMSSSSSSSLISIATVPCIDCVWKIQVDGFYRADEKNRGIFTRLAGWTPA